MYRDPIGSNKIILIEDTHRNTKSNDASEIKEYKIKSQTNGSGEFQELENVIFGNIFV